MQPNFLNIFCQVEADGRYKKVPPATAGAVDGIELGLMSHMEASVEVLASAFGSPCIKGLLRR